MQTEYLEHLLTPSSAFYLFFRFRNSGPAFYPNPFAVTVTSLPKRELPNRCQKTVYLASLEKFKLFY